MITSFINHYLGGEGGQSYEPNRPLAVLRHRKTPASVRNGRAGISPENIVRLSIAFDTCLESRLNQQIQYDLWQAEKRRKSLRLTRIAA